MLSATSNFLDEREDIIEYIDSLQAGVALNEKQIKEGYQKFRERKKTMGQITLKKLAELSGLSIRTVSRVLKNQAYVVPEKRELVLKLAEQYHYVPNMAARNLRLRKRSFVGILCRDFGTEVFVQKINDLELRLSAAGYYPVLGHLDRSPADLERMLSDDLFKSQIEFSAQRKQGFPLLHPQNETSRIHSKVFYFARAQNMRVLSGRTGRGTGTYVTERRRPGRRRARPARSGRRPRTPPCPWTCPAGAGPCTAGWRSRRRRRGPQRR